MKDMKSAILDKLNTLLCENGDEFDITMKADGTILHLTVCFEDKEYAMNILNADYILVRSENPICHRLSGSVVELVENLARYGEIVKEYQRDLEKIRCYFDSIGGLAGANHRQMQTLSDWHKSMFGYRPYGKIHPLILDRTLTPAGMTPKNAQPVAC